MSVSDVVQTQLDLFWDSRPEPFDVHAHTGGTSTAPSARATGTSLTT